MGNILILTYKYFAPTRNNRICEPKTSSVGTQTNTKLSEKLTDFNSVAVSSTEVFDKICDICNLDKEAVGYCWNCEQYLCLKCCSHHEKISLSQEHRLIGKSELTEVDLRKNLFGHSLVALNQQILPHCLRPHCNGSNLCSHSYSLKAMFYGTSFQATCFILCDWSVYYGFVTINEKGKFEHHKMFNSPFYNTYRCKQIVNYISFNKTVHMVISYTDGTFVLCKMFQDGGECTSVVPFDGDLAVLVCIPTGYSLPEWQIQFLDMDGNVKKQICYDAAGQSMFETPEHMISNSTGDILFVSDRTKDCVIAIDKAGHVVYKFTDTKIKSPTALACDDEGNVYVVCKNNVVQIDSHGKKCRMLLESDKKYITGICYNPTSRQLIVTDKNKNNNVNVTLFSLQWKHTECQ